MTSQNLSFLITVVVVLVVGTLVYRTWPATDAGNSGLTIPGNRNEEAERSTQVKAILTECNRSQGARTIAKGHITNIGNVDLHYVTVKVLWLNSTGFLVEANETYALNNEILPPGESREFIDVTRKVSAVKCNVETIDWW
jgi:hypothetical protein